MTTIRSTLRRTKSAASSDRRVVPLPSANRYSMVTFFPSIHPSLLSSCWNESTRTALPEAVRVSRKPMRTFPVCCAWAKETVSRKTVSGKQITILLNLIGFAPVLLVTRPQPLTAHGCHLISLFARASTSGGIVRPICFAVLRLITSSNFVGCSTGRSAGLAPLRILST